MRRRGFTLVEVLVALVVASLVVATAASIFATSTDTVRELSARSELWMREANAPQWMSQVFTAMDARNTPEETFEGGPAGLHFRSRYWVPQGWMEPGTITVSYEDGRLTGSTPATPAVLLRDSLAGASFDYLTRYGGDSPWISEWSSRTTPPLAIRLRLTGRDASVDTLLFLVGERG